MSAADDGIARGSAVSFSPAQAGRPAMTGVDHDAGGRRASPGGLDELKRAIADVIGDHASDAIALSHRLHARPEVGFEEHFAADEMTRLLRTAGFTVEQGIGGLETAFAARFGTGGFHATIIAEYDALAELGHACGHNMIAASAYLAAVGLRDVADALGVTVEVIGTPAEEGGGGKIILAEQGVFDHASVAMMVHPSPFEDAEPSFFAATRARYELTGRSAHAAASPAEGRNAADAAVVAQVAIGLLRQQLPGDVRIHVLVENAGTSVNVIPDRARVQVQIRARSTAVLEATVGKVDACFSGAALATGCEVVRESIGHTYPSVVQSPVLAGLYRANAESLGRVFSTDPQAKEFIASTDFGLVSRLVPSLHPHVAICEHPVTNHQPSFTAAVVSPRADRAVVDGATAMAWTLVDASRQISASSAR